MAVTNMCLLRGFRVPDGIVPIYPALTLEITRFFPSTLMTADDEVISSGFLAFCMACISRKGGDPTKNPLMSPMTAPDCMIRCLPPTQFVVCEIDGLRD